MLAIERQHVQRLGAGDARHGVHRQRGDRPLRQRLDQVGVERRAQQAMSVAPSRSRPISSGVGALTLRTTSAATPRPPDDGAARLGVRLVGESCWPPRLLTRRRRRSRARRAGHGRRRRGDPRLAGLRLAGTPMRNVALQSAGGRRRRSPVGWCCVIRSDHARATGARPSRDRCVTTATPSVPECGGARGIVSSDRCNAARRASAGG